MSMGTKLLMIVGIILGVILAYFLMLAMQPATNAIVNTANSTGNWTADPAFEMARGVISSFPIWQWILPGFIGLFGIVMIWRSP